MRFQERFSNTGMSGNLLSNSHLISDASVISLATSPCMVFTALGLSMISAMVLRSLLCPQLARFDAIEPSPTACNCKSSALCDWTRPDFELTEIHKEIRYDFCRTWLRLYDKAELKRTFQSCVWLDECWVRAHPITRRVRYRRGHKPGEHQPQSSPKIKEHNVLFDRKPS